MSGLTDAAIDTLLHMTGRDPYAPEPGRNRLVASLGFSGLAELVEAGLVEGLGFWAIGGDHAWRATRAGLARAAALVAGRAPALTRAQRRYLRWLDLDGEVSFRTFLTHPYYADDRRRCGSAS